MIKMQFDGDLSPEAIMKNFNLEPGGLAQQTFTLAVMVNMLPYWAWRTGRLANSCYDASDLEAGIIVYDVDYAQKMYYGYDETGAPVNYNTAINPLAGPYPLPRMLADRTDVILEEVRKAATNQ